MVMGKQKRGFWVWLGIIAVVGASGCEKLPWSSGQQSQTNAATTSAISPAAATTAAPAAGGPAKRTVAPDDVVATVNGEPISKTDVELRIQDLKALVTGLGREWKPLTSQQMSALLDELVNNELVMQDASLRGLDHLEETQQRLEYLKRSFYTQEWLRWNRDKLQVADEEIQQYYDTNKAGFRQPERRKLRQIVVNSEPEAKQALSKLLSESVDFAAVAQQISTAPTAANGGMINEWVMKANEKRFIYPSDADAAAAGVISLDESLEAAAFAVDKENGLSNYVKGSDGKFHIFQLAKKEDARQRMLSEVRDGIKNFLLAQKLQQSINDLTAKAKVQKYPERLESIKQ